MCGDLQNDGTGVKYQVCWGPSAHLCQSSGEPSKFIPTEHVVSRSFLEILS